LDCSATEEEEEEEEEERAIIGCHRCQDVET
jgi:hypothetical protein